MRLTAVRKRVSRVQLRALGAKRCEVRVEIRVEQLIDALQTFQISQLMLTEVLEVQHAEVVADELGGGGRNQNLAAMAGREQSSAAVEGLAEIVAASLVGVAGVQCHACQQRRFVPGF